MPQDQSKLEKLAPVHHRHRHGLTEVLVHGIGVLRPRHEMILERLELLLHGLDMRGVFKEKNLDSRQYLRQTTLH